MPKHTFFNVVALPLGAALFVAGVAVTPVPQIGAVAAQSTLPGEYGLKPRNGKPGVYVERIDQSHYRVSAYLRSMKGDSDKRLTELADMVMMRAAQFALENGREYFTIIGRLETDTVGGHTVILNGTPGWSEPEQCFRDSNGNLGCTPGKEHPGTPDTPSYDPGFFGRTGIVQFWTGAEGQRMLREREGQPADQQPLPAAAFYKMFRDKTPGKWPELSKIYGERSKRMRGG